MALVSHMGTTLQARVAVDVGWSLYAVGQTDVIKVQCSQVQLTDRWNNGVVSTTIV